MIGFALLVGGIAACDPRPAGAGEAPGPSIQFNRDIRPILSESCFRCHGPDPARRKADLRLDTREGALAERDGGPAIVPGDPEASEVFARIRSEDETEQMPPPGSHARLTTPEVERIRRWIADGAPWQEHWSWIPPTRPEPPAVRRGDWASNPVDAFILGRLEAAGISPSPEADRVTLCRRLHLDLLGLPPTPEAVDAFVADTAPDAYERLVDRLLASPHYGERMALSWLDLVRYADTVGYHSDVERSISPYRDEVIAAFNQNRPFDRFTVEQLAGDLLPGATTSQRVAAAYNMLGMTTEEGGAQAREYLARYAADRVRNAGSVWLGVTLACAECHDHKYDPFTARDFYAFAAFFADIRQEGVGTPKPSLALPTPEQASRLARLDRRLTRLGSVRDGLDRYVGPPAAWTTPGEAGVVLAGVRGLLAIAIASAERERSAVDGSVRKTITTHAGEPRLTRILQRGDWMDETGEAVQPDVPAALGRAGFPTGRRATRLDLARWLVAREHPLTARVFVNRLWKLYFGSGLVDTLDDLGSQGEWPTHPGLLDWLAVEFMERCWDVKHMVRLMVTSAAYHQSSRLRHDLQAIDPSNRLYARQNAFRLEAEFIRDTALAAGGLLVPRIGGESVRPYQPEGYWRFLNFPKREYAPSTGHDQYRRGLYTHWQRTLPHPALLAFDAPSREACTARRPISNTPQAALVLLNDPSFVEAACALASRSLAEGGPGDAQRLTQLWRLVVARTPEDREIGLLATLLDRHRRDFSRDVTAARAILSIGQRPIDPAADPAELAAWTSVARAVLSLDETITRD
jgi:hypothetical protein